ncbi:hypothetical protein SMSK23_0574 [Streptococcus oralis ATCC 35037]|nr:hypothetical protein HMPREF8579_0155 [Streptococcus oralis ATCC 35037]EFO02836.1 hypothetical protein SMSK23_0574 [Streptococcus oralis ATCC 35037]
MKIKRIFERLVTSSFSGIFFFIDIKISNRVDSQYILGKGEKEW